LAANGSEQLGLTVATLTRRRPKMLSALLESLAELTPPPDCEIRFLVVENDVEPVSRDVIDALGGHLPAGPLDYVLEPRIGIPCARNRAVREAIELGHRLVAFIDDDEVVACDWLERFIRGYRLSRAMLLGGPHGLAEPQTDLSWVQARIHQGLSRQYRKKAERAASLAGLDGTPDVNIVTNNWLGETAIFSKHGIWFDEKMRFTGGTDAKFSSEVKQAGLPTAWVADAMVYEVIPPERLTFGYQFRRARDQSNTAFRQKINCGSSSRWRIALSLPPKLLGSALQAVLLLPTNGGTLFDLARTLGWIFGRLGVLLDLQSKHYTVTTGH
jgi:succinoglycan biosynthesis protein ExoM